MHELSVTQGLVDAVLDPAVERPATALKVGIALLYGFPDTLGFSSDVRVVPDEPAQAALFLFRNHPGYCDCGSAAVEVLSGGKLILKSVEAP